MSLPNPPMNVVAYTVWYDQGNISYYSGNSTEGFVPIKTAGEFTVVAADNSETTNTLGTWTAMIVDNGEAITGLLTTIGSLTTQVSLLQTNVANMQAAINNLTAQLAQTPPQV
jgi:hypothetical protein